MYDKPIQLTKEDFESYKANQIIADAMLNCWEAFGSGELPFLGNDYDPKYLGVVPGISSVPVFCFRCAQIKFSQEIKDRYIDLDQIGFTNFLKTQQVIKNGQTYMGLFKSAPEIETKIKQGEDMYIVFSASKGDLWDRVKNMGFSFIPYKILIAPGTGYFYSTLILGSPEAVSKICNK